MNKTIPENDDDLPPEVDFSGSTRGTFHRPNARLDLPLYLDAEVQAALVALAAGRSVTLSDIVNDLLKKAIAIQTTTK
jgi:hypothetical protein